MKIKYFSTLLDYKFIFCYNVLAYKEQVRLPAIKAKKVKENLRRATEMAKSVRVKKAE